MKNIANKNANEIPVKILIVANDQTTKTETAM